MHLQKCLTFGVHIISDLSDCLHDLPVLIVENKLTIPNSFWKNEVKRYRKKWNKNFLVTEQKKLRLGNKN